MTGTQEYQHYQSTPTIKRDLFCSNCGHLILMGTTTQIRRKLVCPKCGTVNNYWKDKKVRAFDTIENLHRHPIVYWAKKYKIPVNSCYMAIRRRGIGKHKQGIGEAKLVSQREFLAGIIFTKIGRDIISRLILTDWILTDQEIKHYNQQ